MRRLALIVISAASIVSCADFPTKPLATVAWGGRVLDRDGAPMQGAIVIIQRTKADQPGSQYIATDAQGAFGATVTEGPYRIRLYPGYDMGYPGRDLGVLEIHRGTPPLEYQYSGTRVSGAVTGPGGIALEAGVQAYSSSTGVVAAAYTTPAGGYSLVIPPGDYEFYSAARSGNSGLPRRSFVASISATDTTIDIDLGGHEIRFAATLNGSAPLAGAGITAEATGVLAGSTVGPDGRATLYLPDGEYRIFVEPTLPPGYLGWGEELHQIVSGPGEFPVDLVRSRWDVTFRWSADASAIPFARIIAAEVDGGIGEVTADFLGKAAFLIRPQHSYEFRVFPPSGSPSPWSGTIPAGADSTFDLYVPAPSP